MAFKKPQGVISQGLVFHRKSTTDFYNYYEKKKLKILNIGINGYKDVIRCANF